MGQLEGKVAFITGTASGIGAACALRFAREGARIAALDVAEAADDSWAKVTDAAPDADFWQADVRDEAAVASAVAAAIERFGRLDIAVNAAGVGGYGAVDELDTSEWDRIVNINLKGTFLVCKYAAKQMLAQGAGSIVNIASIEGIEGFQSQPAYNASKGGVIMLTRNMAVDYGRAGLRINCVCPGLVDTPMTAILKMDEFKELRDEFISLHMLGRPGRPDEVAAAALFLASDEASFVSGHALIVDGGFTAGRRFIEPE